MPITHIPSGDSRMFNAGKDWDVVQLTLESGGKMGGRGASRATNIKFLAA